MSSTSIFLQSRLYSTDSLIKNIFVCMLGVLLLGLSSQLIIPIQPVPITFQSAAAVFLGMILGPRLAAMSVISYFAAGFLGLPIFAHLAAWGPTAGYLIGFLPGAMVSGWLAQRGMAKNIFQSFIAALMGTVVIFSFGIIALGNFLHNFSHAFQVGLFPFILTEPLKLLTISLIIPFFWKKNYKEC